MGDIADMMHDNQVCGLHPLEDNEQGCYEGDYYTGFIGSGTYIVQNILAEIKKAWRIRIKEFKKSPVEDIIELWCPKFKCTLTENKKKISIPGWIIYKNTK